ncbi:MAG: SDR family NAD(P)-dependent oxidoreductase [Bacillota bacterium]
MKKAIVLGATGGTGSAILHELLNRGIETIAFGRSSEKLQQLQASLGQPKHLSVYKGDVFDANQVSDAVKDADVIFQCAAVPYHEMETRQLPLGESVMEAANRLGKKIVIIDGIYPYGKALTPLVNEEHPKNPHTRKGKVKLEFEKLIFSSRWDHARPMIARLPDYYGPTANKSSYLGLTMEAVAAGKPAIFIGDLNVPREYVYLPDVAVMIVELASREEAYGQNWNIPGAGVISGKKLVHIAQKASGKTKPVFPLRKTALRLIGLFDPVIREIVEMLYLTQTPVVLDGSKYERVVGPIPKTPFEKGITDTILALKKRQ